MTGDHDVDFRQIVEAANDVIIVTDAQITAPGPHIIYVNEAFSRLTGYPAEEAIGQSPRMLQYEETSAETRRIMREALEKQQAVRVTVKNRTRHGQPYWLDLSIIPLRDAEGRVSHYAAIEREVTEQKQIERELSELSRTDPLTGAQNRRALDEKLDLLLAQRHEDAPFSILVLDIDNFKPINDQHGHHAGDEYLKALVRLLRSALRDNDMIARMGGEEFCIVLPETRHEAASHIAERLRRETEQMTLQLDNTTIRTTLSIGMAQTAPQDLTSQHLLRRADAALYQAKCTGKNRVCVSEDFG